MKTTTQQDKTAPNPTGKGGFGDHPENRSPGGWKPENTFSYQLNRFKNMTVSEFKKWQDANPEETRTMAEELAFKRILEARKYLKDFQEVANRTEGMPKQTTENIGANQSPTVIILPSNNRNDNNSD
jgi:hypothetical protein